MFRPSVSAASPRVPRAGFSLIEVALALLVAAGGMITVFGVFPVSLRQSQMARSDLVESGFASTLLQTIGGNVRTIDDIAVWNDPEAFWAEAIRGTGLDKNKFRLRTSEFVHGEHVKALNETWTDKPFSPMTTYLASGWEADDEENVWYVGQEDEKGTVPSETKELALPAQFMIRLACIRRDANKVAPRNGMNRNSLFTLYVDRVKAEAKGKWKDFDDDERKAFLPNVYLVSVVSSDRGFPDVFIREPVYSQEYVFLHRP